MLSRVLAGNFMFETIGNLWNFEGHVGVKSIGLANSFPALKSVIRLVSPFLR
jgi:hypothetical protein